MMTINVHLEAILGAPYNLTHRALISDAFHHMPVLRVAPYARPSPHKFSARYANEPVVR